MSSGMEAKITALIASTLQVDPATIRPDSSIADDLGADSLDFVSLILALEDEFHVDIHDEDAAEILTVEQMIEYVESALASKVTPFTGRLDSNRPVHLR
jgi:acyl carrier protein